ncbi:PREDICTED: protein EXECUTER 2, chloroplastic-like isoform X1 [Lupinus angustifolius]|uniref:protein EXECUTER 2, chloroplastic-like isoform X1 n=1 Tax=Lupinus angustifolius TaxID=3871 RepID=UPI00092ED1E1|nr:PREDICTED: protein EXECUTER 2, chloroplastic-like isoform X1 [Lupinus angustifolius]
MVVVANIWGVSQYISSTRTQFRTPSTSFNFHQKKSSTLLVGSWGYHPFRTNLSIFTKRTRSQCCCCSANTNSTSSLNWDWNRWCRHFSDIEEAENLSSVLKFQLEDAVQKEDFHEAAKLNRAIAEATSKDSVAEIMSQLKSAIDDERYHDASRLCKYTGSGLVGWWVGYSKDPDDPFGRIIHVSPGMGRFVGRSYSPRQLITKSTGTPIFEIYVVKDTDNTYHMQVVYLRRAKGNSMGNPPSLSDKSATKPEVENASTVDVPEHEEKDEINDKKNSNMEEATEEGIKSVINFLEQKIPGFKVKVMNINVSVKQLMEKDGSKASSNESPEGEVNNLDEPDGVTLGADSDALEEENDLDMKLLVGGVVQDNEDTPVNDDFTRLPAEIRDMERDSFAFHIPRRNLDFDMREHKVTNINVATMATEGISQLMPPDVADEFWSSDLVSSKVSKSMREIVKLAIVKAQKRSRLSEDTHFRRIPSSIRDSDPFDGLYVGAFGPYGLEIVQLRRKFGHWNDADNENNPSDMEFFEYVEAVKLTGDLNVPAGQVTFRAKIGRGNRNTNRGMYPDELGVVASYNGQGRTADFGFRNPKWVDGELLQFNGKGMGPYMKAADLGFLYSVPEQSVLVLFNRLKLPE